MKKDTQKVAMVSADIENENLQKLRAVFPQFVKDGVIDFDALQAFFKKEGILARDLHETIEHGQQPFSICLLKRVGTQSLFVLNFRI